MRPKPDGPLRPERAGRPARVAVALIGPPLSGHLRPQRARVKLELVSEPPKAREFPEQRPVRIGRPRHARLDPLDAADAAYRIAREGLGYRRAASMLGTSAATLAGVLSGAVGAPQRMLETLRLFAEEGEWLPTFGACEGGGPETVVSVDWLDMRGRCADDRLADLEYLVPYRHGEGSRRRLAIDGVEIILQTHVLERVWQNRRRLPYKRIVDIVVDGKCVGVLAFQRNGYCERHSFVHAEAGCRLTSCTRRSHFRPREILRGSCEACERKRRARGEDVCLQVTGLGCKAELIGLLRSLFFDPFCEPDSEFCHELHVAVDVRAPMRRWCVVTRRGTSQKAQSNGLTYGKGKVTLCVYDKRHRHGELHLDAPHETAVAQGAESWADITRFEFRTKGRRHGGPDTALEEIRRAVGRYGVADGARLKRPSQLLEEFRVHGRGAFELLRGRGLSPRFIETAWTTLEAMTKNAALDLAGPLARSSRELLKSCEGVPLQDPDLGEVETFDLGDMRTSARSHRKRIEVPSAEEEEDDPVAVLDDDHVGVTDGVVIDWLPQARVPLVSPFPLWRVGHGAPTQIPSSGPQGEWWLWHSARGWWRGNPRHAPAGSYIHSPLRNIAFPLSTAYFSR